MADVLKIKLSIANRAYPLTINPKQEEGLRRAAKYIEAMIKQFEQSYSVRDKQDVLAMCALQLASQLEQNTLNKTLENDHVKQKLDHLNGMLDKVLNV